MFIKMQAYNTNVVHFFSARMKVSIEKKKVLAEIALVILKILI